MKRLTARLLWVPVVLVALVYSGACEPSEREELEEVDVVEEVGPLLTPVPRPDTRHSATISVGTDVDTTVAVSPDPLEVRRGDTVEWTAPIGEWEVYLGPNPPTRDLVVAGSAGDTAGTRVRLTAEADTYKYWVAVRLLLGDDTFLVIVDPEIIVENGGD